jgi:hypothetical protein
MRQESRRNKREMDIADSQFNHPDDFYYSAEEVFERANGIREDDEDELPEYDCLFGDECCMSYCLHYEDECHTAEMMQELYKEMEAEEKAYQTL